MARVFRSLFGRRDSKDARTTDAKINKRMEESRKMEQERTASLLLLGAGDSGKSTILKQIRIIHSSDITPGELELQKDIILPRTVKNARLLAQRTVEFEQMEDNECTIHDPTARQARDEILEMKENSPFTDSVARAITLFWSQPEVQATFRRGGPIQCDDTSPWFFERASILSQSDYRPSQEDYIRVRARTTGISREAITVPVGGKPWVFHFTDVGGQRSERKKWIDVFDNVNAVIWVASLSEYDQMLYEDASVNRMEENFSLFNNTMNLDTFSQTDCIVFLNKNDVFQEKIKTIPFTKYAPDFSHPYDPNVVIDWIQNRYVQIFTEEAPRGTNRTLSFHITCATDETIIKNVMDQVMVGLTHARLQKIGMLG